MNNTTPIHILGCGDTPTAFTGFADVVRNVYTSFEKRGAAIDHWAIGFRGDNYWEYPQWRLHPTGHPWFMKLAGYLQLLNSGQFTHAFLLGDPNAFCSTDFPKQFRHVCATKGIRSMLYFPVDAPMERPWCDMISCVDVPVTYTEYGVRQVREAECLAKVHVVPHGVDSAFFQPLPDRKAILREIIIKPTKFSSRQFADEADFLILNVNKNEWRKDPFRSLEILAGLKARGVRAKLIMRMAPKSQMAGTELEVAARHLGLVQDEDWIHLPDVTSDTLRNLYNAADLYLTTTMGEGWGLGITEALACGCPVAMPMHTACSEIHDGLLSRNYGGSAHCVPLPLGEQVCGPIDSRIRRRVDLDAAVERIAEFISRPRGPRIELPPAAKEWLSWDRVGGELMRLLTGKSAVAREVMAQ